MKTHPKTPVARLTALLALLLPLTAAAFELKPMTETFEPSGRGVNRTFEVRNDLDEEVAVTMTIKARSVATDGTETLKDTADFAMIPTQILLKSKSAQVVRVRWQGDSKLGSERSYRIIAEQVPLKRAAARPAGPSMAIKMILRFGGTIYVAPVQAAADVVVASAGAVQTAQGTMLELLLENRGTRHAILEQPSLSVKAGEVSRQVSEADVSKALAGENLLAGASRRVRLPWPSGLPVGPVDSKLNATFLR